MTGQIALLHNYLIVGALLLGIGLVGFLSRRNMLIMFLSAQTMLQGVWLSLAGWSGFHNDLGGQVLVIFIVAAAAAQAAIALALVLVLLRQSGKLDPAAWDRLSQSRRPPPDDDGLCEQPAGGRAESSESTATGVQPEIPHEQPDFRRHV